jgi:reactive intermediate/imine deaminase
MLDRSISGVSILAVLKRTRTKERIVDKTRINPWSWQDRFKFSQAWKVDGARSIVFVSGQGPVSPDGQLLHEGDFQAQARQALENLRAVLEQAGASPEDVVKVTVYVTDMTKLGNYIAAKADFFGDDQPASTAVSVTSLVIPGMMIEIEATAVL